MRSPHPARTRFGPIAIAVAVALVLSACGTSSAGAPASSAATGVSGADNATSKAFPISIDHKFGTTTINSLPERVVSVGYTEHDTLLALGVIPVGVTDWYGDQPYATWPWAQDELGDATPEVLSLADGFQFERIAALKPDVIIGTNAGMAAEDYTKLSAIAPTIAQSGQYTDYFEPWYVQSQAIGTAIGKQAEVTDLVAAVRQQFTDAAAAHPEFAGVPAIYLQNAVYEGSVIAYQKGLSTDYLTDLGFDIPAELDAFATEGGQAYVPVEQLTVLDSADVLIW
ncbi:MAG: ABC transporter substrate-binding protein, partial [Nakamurella sp.]